MEIIKEESAADFLDVNEEILLKKESQNNLMLGLADSILHSKRPSEAPLFYTIRHDGDVCGQVIRTDPDKPLILSDIDENSLIFLVKKLKESSIKLNGAVGPNSSAKVFSWFYPRLFSKRK